MLCSALDHHTVICFPLLIFVCFPFLVVLSHANHSSIYWYSCTCWVGWLVVFHRICILRFRKSFSSTIVHGRRIITIVITIMSVSSFPYHSLTHTHSCTQSQWVFLFLSHQCHQSLLLLYFFALLDYATNFHVQLRIRHSLL